MSKSLLENLDLEQIKSLGAQIDFDEKRNALLIKFENVVLVASETSIQNWDVGYIPAHLYDEFIKEFDTNFEDNRLGLAAYCWKYRLAKKVFWSNYELIQGVHYGAELSQNVNNYLNMDIVDLEILTDSELKEKIGTYFK